MPHHTRWYRMSKEKRKAREAKGKYRVTKADHQSTMGGRYQVTATKECMSCNRRMPVRPIWRTQCKDCDPTRTVD